MITFLDIVLMIAALNWLFWWFKERELITETLNRFGFFSIGCGVERPDSRDFELTFQWHPLYHFNLQVSLWVVYFGCVWSRDSQSYIDWYNRNKNTQHCRRDRLHGV